MQKVQLADRLGNVQTKKIGFSWLHFFFGPLYLICNRKILLGILEALLIFYLFPIPGMSQLLGLINKIPFITGQIYDIISSIFLLFRSSKLMKFVGILFFIFIHILYSFRIRSKILRRYMKKKQLRPVEEKDARILIKWGACKENIGLAESFDIRETTNYKSAEENWYENNQTRIKQSPSYATRSTLNYTTEQKANAQKEQVENLYKLGLISKDEYNKKMKRITSEK